MMEEEYVCTLSPATVEKAQKELNENPKDRLAAVQALRKWVEEQPHIIWPTATRVLLQYLRPAKFSQLRAREMINNVATLSTEKPEWFKDIDTHDPKIQAVIDTQYLVPLGRTKDGVYVVLQRLAAIDPKCGKYDKYDTMRASSVLMGSLMKEEETQVHGIMYLLDCTGMKAGQNDMWSIADIKIITKLWQNAAPMRFKGFHFYNSGIVIDTFMQLMMPFLSKKFRERMHFHGNNLEHIYKVIPMEILPKEYLPDDYDGPCQGSCDDIINKWRKEVLVPEYRNIILEMTSRKWGVDESKRPKEQLQESFRKLNVD